MFTAQRPSPHSTTIRAVLHTLIYFERFAHPLTLEEIHLYCSDPEAGAVHVQAALNHLQTEGLVFTFNGYYQSLNDDTWLAQRLANNQRADQFLPRAARMARFIGGFPFVRGVMVSGSLSKHSMRPDSDVDFFVITSPGRLWLSRTMLVIFKKIFLFNSHKYFCVNYFIDTEHLEIEEKNLFTATETVTLLPMYGPEWYEAFAKANTWAWQLFPHFPVRPTHETTPYKRGWLKLAAEYLLGGKFGVWLDMRCMKFTINYWQQKFKHLNPETFEVALKSKRYVSKHHPLHFQQQILERMAQRLQILEDQGFLSNAEQSADATVKK